MVKPLTQIHTFKLLKPCRSISQDLSLTKCRQNPPPASNARPQTCLKTQEAVSKLRWTVLHPTPYTPDLAPSDFHLFGALKDAICLKRFGSDDNITEVVKMWLWVHNSNWHKKGTDTIVSCWHKSVEVNADYVEKIRCITSI